MDAQTEPAAKPVAKMTRAEILAELGDYAADADAKVADLRLALERVRAETREEVEEVEGEVVADDELADAPSEEADVGDEIGQALALREKTTQPQSALPSVAEFNASLAIAERIAKTNFVPVAYRGRPDDVLAAILFGREIGLGPMQSLRDVYMVDGRPSLAAHLQLALLRRGGVRILESEATRERAFIRAQRVDTGEIMAVEWTYEEASKIISKGKPLVGKDNWQNYPSDMLFARCVGRLTRRLGSDLIGGLPPYVAEEVADFSGWGVEYGEGGSISLSPQRAEQTVRREGPPLPKTWAEISSWAEPYGPQLGWSVWIADAAEVLYGERESAKLSVEQKKTLGQKAAGAVVALREAVDPGAFPPPTREDVQKAWGKVLDGEILAGPMWSFSATDGLPTYWESEGIEPPEPKVPDERKTEPEEPDENDHQTSGPVGLTPEEQAEIDEIPFGDDGTGYGG